SERVKGGVIMAVTRWRPRWRIRRWEPFRRMEDDMDRFLAE
ncbi:unnamed protein product, partial [marine sediment metagenome]